VPFWICGYFLMKTSDKGVSSDLPSYIDVKRSAMDSERSVEVLDLGLWNEALSDIPDWSARIWRYMDLAKFASMLQNEALYFPVVAELGDDLEAAPPRVPSNASPLQQQEVFSHWSLTRCISFASCWHLAEHESAAMWAIYAGRHQGIAVQSTLNGLVRAFPTAVIEDTNKILKIGRVEYIDPNTETTPPLFSNMYATVLRKRLWYAYENEVRILCSPPDNWVEPALMNEPGRFKRSGVWVRCNLHELIQNVVIAPHAPPYFKPAVSEIFRRFGFDPESVKASMMNERVVAPDSDDVRAALNELARKAT